MAEPGQTTENFWEEIEKRLSGLFGCVQLNCDGYKVFMVKRLFKNRLLIVVYVNDFIKGEHCQFLKENETPCEEARRFFRPSKRSLYSRKVMARINRARKLLGKDFDSGKRISYTPFWNDAKPLVRHLKKTCKSVTFWSETETKPTMNETVQVASETEVA